MSIQSSDKLCVILGAGASFDVATEGNLITNPDNKPPLAKDLFNIKEHRKYNSYLEHYPGAAVLVSSLGARLAEQPRGMEEALTTLANSSNTNIRKQFAQIPMYLHHLISAVTNNYVSRPGAYDSLLISLFIEGEFEVLFIVLNYDLLLEKALEGYSGLSITNINDYMSGSIKLLKPHGSVNWWMILPGSRGQYQQGSDTLNWDLVRKSRGGDIVIREYRSESNAVWQVHLEPSDELWSKYEEQLALYPLITAPLVNKKIGDFVCPSEHTEAAQEFLSSCERFLIIGSQGLDTDLLEFLDETLTHHPKIVHIVTQTDVAQVAERYIQGVSLFMEAHSNNQVVSFNDGFTSYLKSNGVQQLLTSQ